MLIVLLAAVSFRFLLPHREPVRVASLGDLAEGKPLFRPIDRDLAVYLVRLGDKIQAWDAIVPISGCRIRWVAFNNRFEDPCSGAKWCIDGTFADLRHEEATTLRRYEVAVTDGGEIFIDPLSRIDGEPFPEELRVPYQRPFSGAIIDCPSL